MLTCSILVSALVSFVIVVGEEQKIETVLRSKWTPTSLLFEGAEFVAGTDPDLFWKYIDNVIAQQPFLPKDDGAGNETTQEGQLATISAFPLLSSSNLKLMEWALTSRAYSPRVLLLQQQSPLKPAGCGDAFVSFGKNRVYCDLKAIQEIVEAGVPFADADDLLVLDVDHKHPSFVWSLEKKLVAILYADLATPEARTLHDYLKSKSDGIGYILRPYERPSDRKGSLLAGYGVELQFKSTEYKAQDDSAKAKQENPEIAGFNFEKLNELHPELLENLDKFQHHLLTSQGKKKAEFEALKAWQVQELGLQASHFVTLQENVLEALVDVSGNFPSKASYLSSVRVPNDFKKAVAYSQRILQSHFNIDEAEGAIFLQGSYIDPDSLDIFSFQDMLKAELDFMDLLRSVYADRTKKRSEIDTILNMGTKSQGDPDLALDLRDAAVFWINDLEKDEEYEDWPDDLTQLFFRMGGVMLRPVRRNVFNLMLTLNPDDISTTANMLKLAQSFMAHKAPVRIGVVFCGDGEMSNSLDELKSDMIRRVMNHAQSEESVKRAFNQIVEAYSTKNFRTIESLAEEAGEEHDFGKDLACEFVKKGGRPTPSAFLNGVPLKWDSVDDFEEVVLSQLLREAQVIQMEAYSGKIKGDVDIFEYIMNKPHVQTRLNDKILDTSHSTFVTFGAENWEPGEVHKNLLAQLASNLDYLSPSGKHSTPVSVTMWIFADISTEDGLQYFLNAVEFVSESSKHSRVALIPTKKLSNASRQQLIPVIARNDVKALKTLLERPLEADPRKEEDEFSQLIRKVLNLLSIPVGEKGVLVNGRLIGPLSREDRFDVGDWALTEKFTYDSCAKHLDTDTTDPDGIMRICAALAQPALKQRSLKRFSLPEFQGVKEVNVRKDKEDPYYVEVFAVIDPASRVANKIASILQAANNLLSQWLKIQVVFNPPAKHSELPLKSYFRYVAGDKTTEKVVFDNIPKEPLFTQNIITPDNWMVEVVEGIHDLDNIRLRELSESVSSEYELEYLLVEGHCLESKTGSPPRGLQFTLKPKYEGPRPTETIVMANLGYFQLKAEPGVWQLELREGPSRDIFAIESHAKKVVTVSSFQSVVIKVKVKRNPGKETASLLDNEEENPGWFGFGKKTEADEEVLNIFSVASGHLYERLMKIMMTSVLKNTKSKVKFWFLKNYLSPTFKNLLPHMAEEYGFDYELVQYHWPRWLNPQREKQRIIWGYKILFLDVLFPLSLKKFVFVDADQIVRADMKELFELDLEGNPYGYAPFCDSRTEMEGFRFWKKGYWKSHLGKRKYHISALYVVDLVRFRKIAAGDRLRGQYQALSQDPNSLSNLDQDLPNNMIHQVGIKSLPQEWLWCETWCSDASKKDAKTIDLCNNPLTKEPKLEAAKRIAPEWESYDHEIRQFQTRLIANENRAGRDEL